MILGSLMLLGCESSRHHDSTEAPAPVQPVQVVQPQNDQEVTQLRSQVAELQTELATCRANAVQAPPVVPQAVDPSGATPARPGVPTQPIAGHPTLPPGQHPPTTGTTNPQQRPDLVREGERAAERLLGEVTTPAEQPTPRQQQQQQPQQPQQPQLPNLPIPNPAQVLGGGQ